VLTRGRYRNPVIVQYIYTTALPSDQNFGLAAAASMILGALLFALTLMQLLAAKWRDNG